MFEKPWSAPIMSFVSIAGRDPVCYALNRCYEKTIRHFYVYFTRSLLKTNTCLFPKASYSCGSGISLHPFRDLLSSKPTHRHHARNGDQ